ncbi:amidase [Actinomarinicola tropica]|uniref:Amidase n=1 Tax=Actinomarinicola tropica TaxID=2789776 RepID=A0A5Q2RV17_9ACTN|nr:amidase [Actinomarinicola tropica]
MPLTIQDAATALRDGSLTAVTLTEAVLARVDERNDELGAYVTVCHDSARAAAAQADADLAAGIDRGPLQGIPLGIKDIIATADAPTTANSRVLADDWGAGVDAPVTARLRGAGAVLVGKTTTMEFAFGLPDPDKGFLVPRNPWDLERTPGGSSSGTGVAVAAGLALGGLGTDTGGSVRFPASMNGHTGLKVTFGRVPKSGVVPLGFTLDSVGPMARSAWDCAAMLQVMAGHDPSDRFAADVEVPDYLAALDGSVEGLRIGVPMPYFFDADGLDDEVRAGALDAVDALRAAGATIVETEVPGAREAKEANALVLVGEAFAYHRQNLVTRWEDYGRHTRMALGRGALLGAADHVQANRFRTWFRRQVAAVLADVDVLLVPGWPTPALRADDMSPERMVSSPSFTGQWNLTGLPGLTLPSGFSSEGLPLSIQLVGPAFSEDLLCRVGDAYQRATDWHLRVPPSAARPVAGSVAVGR